MKNNFFFVYGTLKKSFGNNRLLQKSKFIGEAITLDSFCMFDVGFPYIYPLSKVPVQDHPIPAYPVRGEVYEVENEQVEKALDRLEGVDYGHYERDYTEVSGRFGQFIVNFYTPTKSTLRHMFLGREYAHIPKHVKEEGELIYEWNRVH
jgi:gamma-glutamylcyclotransferase (GGCT)/AIG2-like uncharacterized protein YtfP